MKKQTRMIKSIIDEAAKTDVVMPWTRGARRAEWIAKRTSQPASLKTVSLKAVRGQTRHAKNLTSLCRGY